MASPIALLLQPHEHMQSAAIEQRFVMEDLPATPPEIELSRALPHPLKFNGCRSEYGDFIQAINTFTNQPQIFPVNCGVERVALISSRLEGDAADWFESLGSTTDFQQFLARLEHKFGNQKAAEQARGQLLSVKQTGPLDQYISKFRLLVYYAALPQEPRAMCYLYFQGLSEDIKGMLANQLTATSALNLDQLISASVLLDYRSPAKLPKQQNELDSPTRVRKERQRAPCVI